MQFRNSSKGKSILMPILIISIIIGYFFYSLMDVETGDLTEKRLRKEALEKKNNPIRTAEPEEKKSVNKTLPQLINKVKGSIVLVTTYDAFDNKLGTGTGFAFKRKNIIVTNRHVVAGSSRVEVKIKGKTVPVNGVLGVDAKADVVLLSISDKTNISSTLKPSITHTKVGESVFVVGNPLGFESTVSTGIVSAIRKIKPFGTVIQITSPISPGSSGSPVFNRDGRVIGVATFVAKKGQNLNFSIPISRVTKIIIGEKNKISNLSKIDMDYFSDLETPYEKGEYLVSNKEYNNALPYLKEAIEEEPENTDILTNLGICYREIGMVQKSIDVFKDVINKDYDKNQAHFELGVTYMKFNMPEKAFRSLDIVYSQEPDYENLNMQLGIVFTEMKSYKKAAFHLEQAIETDFNPEKYYLLGLVYYKMNQIDKATNAMRNALNLEKTNIVYIHMLGLLYYEAGNYRFSIDTLNKGVLLDPGNGNIHFQLGFTYLGYKDLENAELEYQILKELKYKDKNKLRRAIDEYKRYKKYNN